MKIKGFIEINSEFNIYYMETKTHENKILLTMQVKELLGGLVKYPTRF